jgi:L-ascorbate metabolism protein UlaG (beta-lactamase superfamily)
MFRWFRGLAVPGDDAQFIEMSLTMDKNPLYLRPNIQLEPLVDQWYAWSHLISPATAARYTAERHMSIMNSYIDAPMAHAAAVSNPRMLGGPFIDCKGDRVADVVALRERIRKERVHLLEFSRAISALDELVRTKAKGYSLSQLYASVPEILRGYVELVYDLNNQPSFRFIEPLLYKSKYYDRSAQSMVLSQIQQDERPFVLSTPRLDFNQGLHLPIAFDSPIVDRLFRMKKTPATWAEIVELLGVTNEQRDLARSFFTTDPPAPYSQYTGDGVRWRYFGHACILVETKNCSLLLDPVLSYTYEGSKVSRYTYDDLPETIDYVLITHNHQDHVLFETLLQLRHKVKHFIVPRCGWGSLEDPSVKLLLENTGFKNVYELSEMEILEIENGSIQGLPFFGEHADLDIRTKLAYSVKLNGHSIMFVADSCNLEPALYQHLHREIGDADVLFVGMECEGAPLTWLYGSLLTKPLERAMDNSRRLNGSNYEQAIDIVNRFACREVYVYAMGQEPWLEYILSIRYTDQSRPIIESNRLLEDCRSRGIIAERLFGEKEILLKHYDRHLVKDEPRPGDAVHPALTQARAAD